MARLVRLTELAPMKIEAKDIPEGKALFVNHDRTSVIETRPDLPDSPIEHPPQP
jgi:hypothetical protein